MMFLTRALVIERQSANPSAQHKVVAGHLHWSGAQQPYMAAQLTPTWQIMNVPGVVLGQTEGAMAGRVMPRSKRFKSFLNGS